MLYTLICNGMRKEVKSIWWDQGGECWIDLSTNGPNSPLGPWLASGSGTPSPLEGWWALVAQHYKREWGPRAQLTRFAAATVAPTPNPNRPRGDVLKRWEVPPVAAVVINASTESSSPWVAHQEDQGMIDSVNPPDLLLDGPLDLTGSPLLNEIRAMHVL
jgi:hypothetical protein